MAYVLVALMLVIAGVMIISGVRGTQAKVFDAITGKGASNQQDAMVGDWLKVGAPPAEPA